MMPVRKILVPPDRPQHRIAECGIEANKHVIVRFLGIAQDVLYLHAELLDVGVGCFTILDCDILRHAVQDDDGARFGSGIVAVRRQSARNSTDASPGLSHQTILTDRHVLEFERAVVGRFDMPEGIEAKGCF